MKISKELNIKLNLRTILQNRIYRFFVFDESKGLIKEIHFLQLVQCFMAHKNPKPFVFLIGPFIAGGLFALGYGLTYRILIILGGWKEVSQENFNKPKDFPGKGLEKIELQSKKSQINLSRSKNKKTFQTKSFKPIRSANELHGSVQNEENTTKVFSDLESIPKSKIESKDSIFSKENFMKVLRTLPDSR